MHSGSHSTWILATVGVLANLPLSYRVAAASQTTLHRREEVWQLLLRRLWYARRTVTVIDLDEILKSQSTYARQNQHSKTPVAESICNVRADPKHNWVARKRRGVHVFDSNGSLQQSNVRRAPQAHTGARVYGMDAGGHQVAASQAPSPVMKHRCCC